MNGRQWAAACLLLFLAFIGPMRGQTIREAVVKRTENPPLIDGRLSEPQWHAAGFTERFVRYQDGGATGLSTRAQFLWSGDFLFIGFVCEDPDVWATLSHRDDHLWNGEVVEILGDPDGDGRDYFEIQVNPLGTELDLLMDKPYSEGGRADLSWNCVGMESAVSVTGSLNDDAHPDTQWTCEAALPFNELAFLAPSMAFPPAAGNSWRLLVTRYDYERAGDQTVEISSWNRTDSRGFHVPEKFGRIVFTNESADPAGQANRAAPGPGRAGMLKTYPNPFNTGMTVAFDIEVPSPVAVKIYDLQGREVAVLAEGSMDSGGYRRYWDGIDRSGNAAPSGVYLVTVLAGTAFRTGKILLSR